MSQKIKTSVEIDGSLSASQIANATTDTDKFLVSDGGTVKYRTGLEVLSDLGISFGTASKIQHQVKAGVAINKGQAVYVTGADGTNMIVGLASNASEGTSSKTMGLLNNTVAINGFADVITEGLLDGLNTIGATVGDPVWLGTGGNLIYGLVNKPYAPNHLVFIGIVTRVNANNGEIFVKVQNGFELEELHNVLLSNLQNKQLLTYNTSNSLWENKSIGTVLGGTSDQYVKGDGSFSSAMNSRIEVNFVATAGQTTFNTPYEVGQVDVYYNGSKLYPNEFTATDRYSIVLAVGASLNAQISIVKYVSTFSTTAIRNEAIFTTTSGQTTFSVNYAVGQVDVFYNGSKLNTSEFTATDGTSVVLGFACASGESIAIISYINQVSGANGTSNKVAKFTGTATLGDSSISDNGTVVSLTNSDSRLYGGDNVGRFIIGNPTVNTYLAIYGSSHATLPNFAQIIVNNSQAISMYSSGNVFIGSSPADAGYKLDVNGTSRFASVQTGSAGVLHPTTNTGTNASPSYENLISYTSSAVGTSQILGSNYLGSSYGTGIQFRVNSEYYANDPITAVTIRGLGASAAMGIGTTIPSAKIHLHDTSDVWLRVTRGTSFSNIGVDSVGSFYNTNTNHTFYTQDGTVSAMKINSTGNVTIPYQPAWSVGLSSVQNVVANSPTVIYWNQSSGNDCFIQGGVSLNGSNGRITVPVAGKYMLFSSIRTESTGATAGTNLNIRRNGAIILRYYVGGSVTSAGSFMNIETRPVIVNCAANDYIDFYFDSVPGSFNISETSNTVVRFGGYLVG